MPTLSLRQRMGVSLAKFAMKFSGLGGGTRNLGGYGNYAGRLIGALPGSNIDLARDVGDPALNSTASICLNWIGDQIIEAGLQVNQLTNGKYVPIPKHPLTDLIENPNGAYDGDALWGSTVISYCTDGNAYWLKAKGMAGAGRPTELYYVPHWQIQPRWPTDGSKFLSHFDYTVDGRIYAIPVDQVVWFHDKIDPIRRRGISRLYPVLREVATDNEISTFIHAILKNVGVVSVLIGPKHPGETIGELGRKELRQQWDEDFTGDNRGRPLVSEGGIDVQKLAITPEDMALDKLASMPGSKICAALRVPPLVIDLVLGPGQATYANQETAQRKAYHNCILPLGKRLAKTVGRQLLPDFDSADGRVCLWDYSSVECLQEDVNELHKRARDDYQKGVVMRDEARAWIGLPPAGGEDGGFYKPPPKGDGLDEKPKKGAEDDEEDEDD